MPLDQELLIKKLLVDQSHGSWGFFFGRVPVKSRRETSIQYWQTLFDGKLQVQKVSASNQASDGPFHPFLHLARRRFESMTLDERKSVLQRLKIYPLHRPWFECWLTGKEFDRWDDVLRVGEEIKFEKSLIFETIFHLLHLLWAKAPQVFIVERLEDARPSLVSFLLWGIQNRPVGLNKILGLFSAGAKPSTQWPEHLKQSFFSALDTHQIQLLSPMKEIPTQNTSVARVKANSRGRLEGLSLVRIFLAGEDEVIYEKRQLRPKDAVDVRSALELGLVQFLSERFNEAIVPLEVALKGSKTFAPHLSSRINLILAGCFFKKLDRPFAEKYLRLGLVNKKLGLATEEARLGTLFFMMIHEKLYEVPAERDNFLELIRGFRKRKEFGYALAAETSLSYFRAVSEVGGRATAVKRALQILTQVKVQGNTYQEAKLYHQLAYLHQELDPEQAQIYFAKTIACSRSLGLSLGLVKDYNGAGYFNLSRGNFSLALEYFQEALTLLADSKDFTETCLTLFNVSLVYFLSGSFQRALAIYQIILGVLDHLEMESLLWHARAELESFAGISAFFLNQKTFSLDYWEKVSDSPEGQRNGTAYFLLKGLIGTVLGGETVADFDSAFKSARDKNWDNFASFCQFQKALFFKARGQQEPAEESLRLAFETLGQTPSSIQKDLFNGWWESGMPAPYAFPFDLTIENIGQRILQMARQEVATFNLRRKLHEISFFKDFQERVTRDKEESQMFKAACDVILQYFPAESLHFFEITNQTAQILRGYPRTKVFPESFDALSLPAITPFTKPRTSSGPHHFSMTVPIRNRAFREIWMGLVSLTDSSGASLGDMETIQMALKHLELSLDLHRTEDRLKDSIATDHLTGALSRHEFLKRGEKEMQRTMRRSKKTDQFFSVLFLDLDNFKYYNDAFGHGAGDGILKLFTQLVQGCIRDIDSIGRFGGDEFVILLPETAELGARVVGQRILQKLQEPSGFQKALRVDLDITAPISPEKALGCSLGVGEFRADSGLNLSDLLDLADQGLYRAKKAGKNQIG